MIALCYDWDWQLAERECRRALDLNPNYAIAHHYLALYLAATGRLEEAVEQFNSALELDPLSPTFETNVGWCYYWARQYERAVSHFQKALELDPFFFRANWSLSRVHALEGRLDEAVREGAKAVQVNDNPGLHAWMGHLHALRGEAGEALAVAEGLISRSGQQYVAPYYVAEVYAGLADAEQTFHWLEKAFQDRNWFLIYLRQEPLFEPFAGDWRFAELARRIGLSTAGAP